MANEEHLKILKQGVEVWNKWREENPDVEPDLSRLVTIQQELTELENINLENTLLSEASFLSTSLRGATLRRAMLFGATFTASDLTDAELTAAQLTLTRFHSTTMVRTNLENADFHQTSMYEVNLYGANLNGARLYLNDFIAVDLSDTKGLGATIHTGPSVVDTKTLLMSRGLPETFLRGCGLPDSLIDWYEGFHTRKTQYHTCFVSYSKMDQEFADRLYADLMNRGVRCWKWDKDAKGGEPLWRSISEAIQTRDKFVLICSEDSLRSSQVLREIERAVQKEDELQEAGKQSSVLLPIRIDNYVIDSWEHERKADVTKYKVLDFTSWKNHDEYQKAFDRLLRDLVEG